MDLYNSINRRKSTRSYTNEPFAAEKLAEIEEALGRFDKLYPTVPLSYRFATKTKGMYNVKAPHYIVASGQGAEGEMVQAGFILEQLVLWLDAQDIGSIWLGSSKDVDKNSNGKDIIILGFGEASEPVHRELSGFKRKPIEDITNAPDDPCIQAVHLAPSGMNLQPWYLQKADDKTLFYEQILKGPIALAYDKVKIDLGIALCHYMLACKHTGRVFSFTQKEDDQSKKGYRLFGELVTA